MYKDEVCRPKQTEHMATVFFPLFLKPGKYEF